MTLQRTTLDGGWTGLQEIDGGYAGGITAATRLIDILDTIDLPIVVVRRDLAIGCFNQAAADVLGLLPSDVGRACRDVPVLARMPRLEEQCSQVIAGAVECRTDFRDGDTWFVVRMSPATRGDRLVTAAVLTFTNVTAFRASIDQAIYERECTKAILNTVADPLIVVNADERIQSGNRAFYTMFGVSRDETQGVPFHEFANGAFEVAPLRAQLAEMLAGSHSVRPVEVDYVTTGKGRRTLILDARPLTLPGLSERRVLVTFRDITACKQAEAARDLRSAEELRRSETFLAEAQRLSSTGSFSWRVATDEITGSDQLYRIFEFERGLPITLELIGSRVHPDDIPLFDDMIDCARDTGSDLEYEHRLLMPDRTVKHLHLIADGTRDRDGRLEYLGAVQDVTQRRLSEEALARARSELAHVARVASLGALTASIAHEVNQPLSGIITNASTCLRMLVTDPPNLEGAKETARRTIRDGQRASDVITRLRRLFVTSEMTAEPVDLNEATREVITLSMSELQQGRVVLRTELAEDLPAVTGDRIQLQQVVLNLLRNAVEAMSDVDDRPRDLLVRTEPDGHGAVRLSVRDAGAGIAPDRMDRLFDTFHTTKSAGMGIGLSVSRSIIESHHGWLRAAPNDDGPGATFEFSVPCEMRTL